MSNCPNCGAPIVSSKCEYCGTVHGRDVSSNDPCLYVEFNKEADNEEAAIKIAAEKRAKYLAEKFGL